MPGKRQKKKPDTRLKKRSGELKKRGSASRLRRKPERGLKKKLDYKQSVNDSGRNGKSEEKLIELLYKRI